ncbi:MAG: helix-turn-helix domain-containing protein [bacterium]|nr:helix-turn-helix domain-containing protein [bacterium]
MYKIMLADDEGIVIDSLKFIIDKNFKGKCEVQSAKTGRAVIELAEAFRPDITFMDIQMPGINGIEAMKEIRKTCPGTIFIILSAYDKFDYAKDAINLGVMEYLHKPVSKKVILSTIEKAMAQIDEARIRRSDSLKIKEKLEIVVPMMESGFVSEILLQGEMTGHTSQYKELLGIHEDFGIIMVLEYGAEMQQGKLTNPIGTSFQVQPAYASIRELIKEFFPCIVGPMLTNKITCFYPQKDEEENYESRNHFIVAARELMHKLNHLFDLKFRIGIGSVRPIQKIYESYEDAVNALNNSDRTVAHCRDLPIFCGYDQDYPSEKEKELFEAVKAGSEAGAEAAARSFFHWMETKFGEYTMDIKLKVLEFVLWAERIAYESGGMVYHFRDRKDYLPELLNMNDLSELQKWFLTKIILSARNVHSKKHEYTNNIVEQAKDYINANYNHDLSLEGVSRQVDVSSYYFSKLFKDVVGMNFIEYVTKVRIQVAKSLLKEANLTIKEVCADCGYSDPNYFSRIFKKYEGITPSEYREGNM